MKRLILLILVLLFSVIPVVGFAQTANEKPDYEYEPLVQDGAWWLMDHISGDAMQHSYWYTIHYFEGDTLIGENVYKKFFTAESNYVNPLIEFYREEDKKVYRYDEATDSDLLIFNFSGELGDTVNLSPYIWDASFFEIEEVKIIEPCYMVNDNQIKRFKLTNINWPYQQYWQYERIGTLEGFGHPFTRSSQTYFSHLRSFGLNNEILYGSNCPSVIDEIESFEEMLYHIDTLYLSSTVLTNKSINIYPNPANDIVNVDSDLPVNLIEIYSIDGKRVAEFSNERLLNITHLAKGIYLISVELEGGELFKQKIVRQ